MPGAPSDPEPIGLIEWDSIATGMLAADGLLKEASVTPLLFRPVTPGRYVALFSGPVEEVRSALHRGLAEGGPAVLDSLFLARPHPGIREAVGARARGAALAAVGVIETLTIASTLLAADAAAKAALVQLIEIRLAMGLGGKSFVVLTGEVAQVEAGVAEGTRLAVERGRHLRSVVIPRPDERFAALLADPIEPFSDCRF
jgi:microcompartment protein CcmL/EutN